MTTTVAMQRRLGAQATILSPEDLAAAQPHLSVDGIAAAAYEPLGGYADGTATNRGFLLAARHLGVEIRERVRVTGIRAGKSRVEGVETSAGPVTSPIVVIAAGAWAGLIAMSPLPSLPIIPTRMTTGIIRFDHPLDRPRTFIDTVTDTFFRPGPEPHTAAISIRDRRHNTLAEYDSPDFQDRIEPGPQHEAIARISKRIPVLASSRPLRAWAGVDGVTPDYRGIYGMVPELEGLYLAVGGNFKGFKVAPAVGECLSELITSGRSHIDLSPFSLARFQDRTDFPSAPPTYNLTKVS